MSTQRPERVREAIRQEVSKIVHDEIKDPRLGFITITGVELTKDLRYARIYFSVLGEEKDKQLALKGLKSAKGYIKSLLGDRIKIKFMPEIEFKIDKTLERTQRVYDILDKIRKERPYAEGDSGDKET
ncbi:MAG: 30S ribosome-binding factor RbfA [Candidatus Omnitrophica bacterium]|nr:30S ribosome-binding factor RbfA [Candidatus Omnitrophota bacterium]